MFKLLRHCMNMVKAKSLQICGEMSTICIPRSGVLRNYAPCSDTCCIVLHENSIRVIRVPYEYTVNWQQIPLFIFNRSAITSGIIMAFCFSPHSLPFFFFPKVMVKTNTKRIVSLGCIS